MLRILQDKMDIMTKVMRSFKREFLTLNQNIWNSGTEKYNTYNQKFMV